jgi:hypothetical protein
MDNILKLENKNFYVKYSPEPAHFTLIDLTDTINGTTAFNQNFRGHVKAWKALCHAFNKEMTFGQAVEILDSAKMKMHVYCSVD